MSISGLSNLVINLASSFAGTLRNSADADRIKNEQARQKMHADVVELGNPELVDQAETELSHGQVTDRDADGRLPWTIDQEASARTAEPSEEPPGRTQRPDAPEGSGQILDLDA